jgi:hypothetical protein
MISQLFPRDPTLISELMVRRRVQPTPYIESPPDKGGDVTCPVEHSNNGTSKSVWMKITSTLGGA